MGEDSVSPFLSFEDKWVILLALTSNQGSQDFQLICDENNVPLYERVMRRAMEWGARANSCLWWERRERII